MFSNREERQQAVHEGLRTLYKQEEKDRGLARRVFTLAVMDYDEDNAVSNHHMAMALGAMGRKQETIVYFERAIELDEQNPDFKGDFASTLLHLGMPILANQYSTAAGNLEPDNGQYNYIQGLAQENLGKLQKARKEFYKARAKLELVLIRSEEEELFMQYSQDALERITVKEHDAEELANVGISLLHRGYPTHALPMLQKAVEEGSKNPDTYVALCGAHRINGNHNDAEKAIETATKLDPKNLFNLELRAFIYQRNAKPVWARRDLVNIRDVLAKRGKSRLDDDEIALLKRARDKIAWIEKIYGKGIPCMRTGHAIGPGGIAFG